MFLRLLNVCVFMSHVHVCVSLCVYMCMCRGKSGPLFHFDVHEDVRTINDARIEKDESHAGKIVERHWCVCLCMFFLCGWVSGCARERERDVHRCVHW
jgi:hypothetical protein